MIAKKRRDPTRTRELRAGDEHRPHLLRRADAVPRRAHPRSRPASSTWSTVATSTSACLMARSTSSSIGAKGTSSASTVETGRTRWRRAASSGSTRVDSRCGWPAGSESPAMRLRPFGERCGLGVEACRGSCAASRGASKRYNERSEPRRRFPSSFAWPGSRSQRRCACTRTPSATSRLCHARDGTKRGLRRARALLVLHRRAVHVRGALRRAPRDRAPAARLYHMEHGGGWKPDDEDMDDLPTRVSNGAESHLGLVPSSISTG